MSFLDRLLGRSKTPSQPPPSPNAFAPKPLTPEPPKPPEIEYLSPLEAVPGVVAALDAFKRGDRSLATQIYRGTRDSGLRLALVRELADLAPDLPDLRTPLDAAVNDDDPFWQIVRGVYHVRRGWDARGSGTGDTVTDEGATVLMKRCALAVEDLEDAATALLDDELPLVALMHAARGLSDKTLGRRAYEEAIGRNPDSWAAAQQRIEWLSPRWFGSIDEVLAYARAESQRVGTGPLAALPILAHNDINIFHVAFEKDREAASAARHAAAAEIRDCVARSVDAPNAADHYATPIIRHFAGSLLWQVADEAGAKAQLSKVGNIFEPWCWLQNVSAYSNVRSRLGLDHQ